ncbi:hypothetical protein CKAH01_00544 [Colletotrichum kahawae]|uniref:Uncharacterized protein n=1 Tax=Colletotrichum kahawae TaxID=34407 RepID=A0AAE0D8Z3_COLKA|nr:hypothetical protein CKAH01_00544 [Colletotrichum kahawae]
MPRSTASVSLFRRHPESWVRLGLFPSFIPHSSASLSKEKHNRCAHGVAFSLEARESWTELHAHAQGSRSVANKVTETGLSEPLPVHKILRLHGGERTPCITPIHLRLSSRPNRSVERRREEKNTSPVPRANDSFDVKTLLPSGRRCRSVRASYQSTRISRREWKAWVPAQRILSARHSSLLSMPLHNTRAETLRRIAENPPAYACVIDGPQMGPLLEIKIL